MAVSRAALQPGDLLFFSNGGVAYHVAIYAGQGLIIESPSPGHPVEQVQLSSFSGLADYSGARRVLAGSAERSGPAALAGPLAGVWT